MPQNRNDDYLILTPNGTPAFHREITGQLTAFAEEAAALLAPDFLALVLGGGYGRGEGACVTIDGRESLYNDLDLFIITKKSIPLPETLWQLVHRYEQIFNIEIDIGRLLTPAQLATLPHQLMWQDLLQGHIVLKGDTGILRNAAPAYLDQPLPAEEALRLLLNRGSGLLQAMVERNETDANPDDHQPPDADFIRRNYQKCALALGDSLLISLRQYPLPYAERIGYLSRQCSPSLSDVLESYAEAIAFKQNPDSLPKIPPGPGQLAAMAAQWSRVLLHTEQERTGRHWDSPAAYSRDAFIRERSQHRGRLLARNIVKNLRERHLSVRYPRESLYRDIARLLDEPKPGNGSWRSGYDRFLELWRRYN